MQSDVDIIGSSHGYHRIRPDRDALEQASRLLSQAENPVIIIGDRIAQSGGVEQMVQVAERLGARVFAASFSEVNFPTSHPLWSGMLNTSSPATRRLLSGADVALAVGANIFSQFLYVDTPLLDPTTKLVHLDSAAARSRRTIPPKSECIRTRPRDWPNWPTPWARICRALPGRQQPPEWPNWENADAGRGKSTRSACANAGTTIPSR